MEKSRIKEQISQAEKSVRRSIEALREVRRELRSNRFFDYPSIVKRALYSHEHLCKESLATWIKLLRNLKQKYDFEG